MWKEGTLDGSEEPERLVDVGCAQKCTDVDGLKQGWIHITLREQSVVVVRVVVLGMADVKIAAAVQLDAMGIFCAKHFELEFDLSDQEEVSVSRALLGVETVLALFGTVGEEEGCLVGDVVEVLAEDEVRDLVARDAEVGRALVVEDSVECGDALEGVARFFCGWPVEDVVVIPVDGTVRTYALDLEWDSDGADNEL